MLSTSDGALESDILIVTESNRILGVHHEDLQLGLESRASSCLEALCERVREILSEGM
jgi:DNA-binding winged helix-turn-helix (wHTH) protein